MLKLLDDIIADIKEEVTDSRRPIGGGKGGGGNRRFHVTMVSHYMGMEEGTFLWGITDSRRPIGGGKGGGGNRRFQKVVPARSSFVQ